MRVALLRLLEIKDSDMRLDTLHQCRHAIDRGLHAGGAFSAITPLTALFYGGFIDIDIENPTKLGQDMFVLSKGHAVAAMASIYADLGYFDRELLKNSRSASSILNGHPGPILPGAHIATGPMGQGLGVAQGYAIVGQDSPHFDVYSMTGDGELQEGAIWESVMFAGYKKLDNLCTLVDHNGGQLDIVDRLLFPYNNIVAAFEGFGWKAMLVDATKFDAVYDALAEFKFGQRDGRPTAIICQTTKGHGGFSSFMNKHKVAIDDALLDQENALQSSLRKRRETGFLEAFHQLSAKEQEGLISDAHAMNLNIGDSVERRLSSPIAKRAPIRNKKVEISKSKLPEIAFGESHATADIVREAMKVYAISEKVASIDSDLSSTSGLFAGVSWVDQRKALNVGVAEANMMLIGEAFASLGLNTWVSTFCPFFDWKVLRRIAIGHQERLEAIEAKDGWLSEGHGLDLTFLATASNFETQTNGATHMGNDDAHVFSSLAHVKVIDVSCPRLLLSIIEWIMQGNRGIVYLRVLRAASTAIYDSDFAFGYGKAYTLKQAENSQITIISSGRGTHEALAAAEILLNQGVAASVVDMPSIDRESLIELYQSEQPLLIAEQNNGWIWDAFRKTLIEDLDRVDTTRLHAINTRGSKGALSYIHSGTYVELTRQFGLDAESIAKRILSEIRL